MKRLLFAVGLAALPMTGEGADLRYEFAVTVPSVEQAVIPLPHGLVSTVPLTMRKAWIYGPYDSAEACARRKVKVLRGEGVRLVFDCQPAGGFEDFERRTQ